MHIVQVLLDRRIGGAERLADTLTREWRAAGDTTEIVLLDPGQDDSTRPPARLRRLHRALASTGADLIVAHSALPNLYARIAAPVRTPVVSVLHSAQDDFEERSLRIAESVLHRRGAVVGVSVQQLDAYRRRFPRAQTHLIANGISPELPVRPSRSTAGALRIVSISRVADQKRPELWQQIAREAEGARLTFEWYGPFLDDGWGVRVDRHEAACAPGRFMGSTDAVGDVLAGADAFLHTASREASSIGLMEAAAVGLPILCASTVASTLPDGLPWAVFDGTEDALKALERLQDEYPQAQAHAGSWRDAVRAEASADRCAAAYRRLAGAG